MEPMEVVEVLYRRPVRHKARLGVPVVEMTEEQRHTVIEEAMRTWREMYLRETQRRSEVEWAAGLGNL